MKRMIRRMLWTITLLLLLSACQREAATTPEATLFVPVKPTTAAVTRATSEATATNTPPAGTATSLATIPPTLAPTSMPTATSLPPATATSPAATDPPPTATNAPVSSVFITSFTADVAIADPGDTITLSWATTGATSAVLWWHLPTLQLGGSWDVAPIGSLTYTIPEHRRNVAYFTLIAVSPSDAHASASLEVQLHCTGEWFIAAPPAICPYDPPLVSTAAEQPFEFGTMIWIEALDQIVVLFGDGGSPAYSVYSDEWEPGDPESDPTLAPPAGYYQPVRGFGLVWREGYGDVRGRLGWATAPEQGFTTQYQQTSYAKYNESYLQALNGGVWYLQVERTGWQWLPQ